MSCDALERLDIHIRNSRRHVWILTNQCSRTLDMYQ